MSHKRVSVALLVQDRFVIGQLSTNGRRLKEILVEPTSNYLRLADTTIVTAAADDIKADEAIVFKSHVALIALMEDAHEAEDKRYFGFVEKKHQPASLVVSGWQVLGKVHFKGRIDPVVFLEREVNTFFPLTEVAISRRGESSIRSPVVFVNRDHVSLCTFGLPEHTDEQDGLGEPPNEGAAPNKNPAEWGGQAGF